MEIRIINFQENKKKMKKDPFKNMLKINKIVKSIKRKISPLKNSQK